MLRLYDLLTFLERLILIRYMDENQKHNQGDADQNSNAEELNDDDGFAFNDNQQINFGSKKPGAPNSEDNER